MFAAPRSRWRRGSHLSDGDLFRALDGEELSTRLAQHLSSCLGCNERLQILAARSARFTSLLDLPEDAVPRSRPGAHADRPTSRHSWAGRVAIVAALLAAGTLLSPHAWAGILRLGELIWVSEDVAGAPTSGAPIEARVMFAPSDTVLTVRFLRPDTRGRLTVRRSHDSLVSLRALRPGTSVQFIVAETAVDLANHAEAVDDYELTVPSGVARLLVRIGDGPAEDIPLREIDLKPDFAIRLGEPPSANR